MPVDHRDSTGNLLIGHGRHRHIHIKTIIQDSYPSSVNLYRVICYDTTRPQLAAELEKHI
jgi:hypothetical protein